MTEGRAAAASHVLGIDIGGSALKGAPVDVASGQLTAPRLRLPTPRPATPAAVAMAVAEMVRHFAWNGPVGIGLPAVIRNDIVRTASNLDTAWIGIDGPRLFAEATGCPVRLFNDADAAGLAEMRFGAGRERQGTVLLVTVGTGLGTALFRNGILVPNCELGHLLLRGKIAEKYASAAVREQQGLSYRQWAKRFDRYLHRLEELFWPDLFIIGGGISKHHEKFLPHLTVATETIPAALRNDAGIVGAALTATGLPR
ncbi:MAG: ROK family protein [Desulfuromonadales bacterium]|nr:ROK family protein [Desulfuromonadales bacterium]